MSTISASRMWTNLIHNFYLWSYPFKSLRTVDMKLLIFRFILRQDPFRLSLGRESWIENRRERSINHDEQKGDMRVRKYFCTSGSTSALYLRRGLSRPFRRVVLNQRGHQRWWGIHRIQDSRCLHSSADIHFLCMSFICDFQSFKLAFPTSISSTRGKGELERAITMTCSQFTLEFQDHNFDPIC
jgi:hypothetical protein